MKFNTHGVPVWVRLKIVEHSPLYIKPLTELANYSQVTLQVVQYYIQWVFWLTLPCGATPPTLPGRPQITCQNGSLHMYTFTSHLVVVYRVTVVGHSPLAPLLPPHPPGRPPTICQNCSFHMHAFTSHHKLLSNGLNV